MVPRVTGDCSEEGEEYAHLSQGRTGALPQLRNALGGDKCSLECRTVVTF